MTTTTTTMTATTTTISSRSNSTKREGESQYAFRTRCSRYCLVSIVGHREAVAFVEEKNTVWISRGCLRAGLLSLMIPRLVNAFPTLPLLLITVRELSNGSLLTETTFVCR
ncbi:hypothetical protein K0M31_010227 [Melipona bicolor]|uniref:Uncharacterized protein n=1 Tax=Melipona bicolor TaxID=60889 RepID=A0AA40FM41_9HYME|nr:hypothetical protein K0M31_010227 [Melipona bicolor]